MTDTSGSSGMGGAIDGLVSSTQSALMNLDAQQGATAIGQVLGALRGVPGTEAVAASLSSLQDELTSSAPDGSRIANLLTTLSSQTQGAVDQAGPLGPTLQALSDGLATASTQVA